MFTHVLPYIHTRTSTHTRTRVHAPAHMCTHAYTLGTRRPARIPLTPPRTHIPDGDHVPTVALDVPAAVGARRVVEGPGRAVDDATPLRVLFQFPAAGSCQERRPKSAGLAFG